MADSAWFARPWEQGNDRPRLFSLGGTYQPSRKSTGIMWSDSHRGFQRAEGDSQCRNAMSLLRAARPDDMPLTVTALFLGI